MNKISTDLIPFFLKMSPRVPNSHRFVLNSETGVVGPKANLLKDPAPGSRSTDVSLPVWPHILKPTSVVHRVNLDTFSHPFFLLWFPLSLLTPHYYSEVKVDLSVVATHRSGDQLRGETPRPHLRNEVLSDDGNGRIITVIWDHGLFPVHSLKKK